MIKILEIKGLPQEAGYYFAREKSKDYWEFLVDITGENPFLRVESGRPLFAVSYPMGSKLDYIFSEKLELTDLF
jgi:hypothetical protein